MRRDRPRDAMKQRGREQKCVGWPEPPIGGDGDVLVLEISASSLYQEEKHSENDDRPSSWGDLSEALQTATAHHEKS